ncbi:ankyrin repeat domain-containing protein [Parahaliea mediterranea]|uniref:ankyrin repeat domain-containing protein n=1 Tax=Parahaliea mediterranea TaxID=651086 RepID=UPI001300707A|nr:ankyrin repeat domain-containing protein [Parahaliea mediterranea]
MSADRQTRQWLSGATLAVALWLCLAAGESVAKGRPGCERNEIGGLESYTFDGLVEQRSGNFWELAWPAPGAKAPAELLPPQDLGQMAADPAAAGAQLLAAIDARLCRQRPALPELKWKTFLQAQHGGGGGLAWQSLYALQSIGGVAVEHASCQANFARDGRFLNLACRLVLPEHVALREEQWPDDATVIAAAEKAYLADLANVPGPGQSVATIERRYYGEAPVVLAHHSGCGWSSVHALTLEASYACDPEPAVPAGQSAVDDGHLLLLDDIPPYFTDGAFVADGQGGFIIAGELQRTWQDEAAGLQIDRGVYLLAYDASGALRWRRRLENASNRFWLYPQAGGEWLVWQHYSEVDDGQETAYAHWQLLSAESGQPLQAARRFILPSYGELQVGPAGQRVYLQVSQPRSPQQLWAMDRNGTMLWKSPVGDTSLSWGFQPMAGGGVAVLLVNGPDDEHYTLRQLGPGGETVHEATLQLSRDHSVALLQVGRGRADIKVETGASDARAHAELQSYSLSDGELLQRRILPREQMQLLPDGQVVYFGRDKGWALVGEEGPGGSWRRHLRLGPDAASFSHAVVDGDELVLLAHVDYPRKASTTPDRRAVLRINRADARQFDRATDCPLVRGAELRELELTLWQDFHLTFRTPYEERRPDWDCPDRQRIQYRDFMVALTGALAHRDYLGRGFFAVIELESGQPGVQIRGGSEGFGYQGGQRGYAVRAEFGDADALAAFLHEKLEPHARRSFALRDAFFLHTGVGLAAMYPYRGEEGTLAQYQTMMERLLAEVRRKPATAYLGPDHLQGAVLALGEQGLSFQGGASTYTESPIAVPEFSAATLLSLLKVHRSERSEQYRQNCSEALQRDRDAQERLNLALECKKPAQIRQALAQGANPHHVWEGAEGTPAVHGARGYPKGLAMMLAAGAALDERDRFGNTLLHTAARHGERANLLRLARDYPALANTTAYDGATALHRALVEPRYDPAVLAPLISAQRDINARNIDGETALHLALHSPAVVARLLAAGADPNARDERGRTPLHRAAAMWLGQGSIAELLAAGADAALQDADGKTALDIARQRLLPANADLLGGVSL